MADIPRPGLEGRAYIKAAEYLVDDLSQKC